MLDKIKSVFYTILEVVRDFREDRKSNRVN